MGKILFGVIFLVFVGVVSLSFPVVGSGELDASLRGRLGYLAGFSTKVPIFFINPDSNVNQRLMMEFLLGSDLAGEKSVTRLPFEPVEYPSCRDKTVAAGANANRDAISHFNAISKALASGSRAALILEDDMMGIFPKMWDESIDQLVDRLYIEYGTAWDIVRLHTTAPHDVHFPNMWKYENSTVIPTPLAFKECCRGTAAYLISSAAMSRIFSAVPVSLQGEILSCLTSFPADRNATSFFNVHAPQQYLRLPQLFGPNIVAAERDFNIAIASDAGREFYQSYVTGVQQVMELHLALSPSPGDPKLIMGQYTGNWVATFQALKET